MRVKENITVYECEHCKKRLFKKAAMEAHETGCYSNPDNARACSNCQHIERLSVPYYFDTFDGEGCKNANGFRCTKLDKILFPYKVEKMGLNTKYPESFENQEPMPKTCEHFEFIF